MNLEELPVYSVMESMSEEDKKTYLPGIAFAGIIDYEMQLAQSENPAGLVTITTIYKTNMTKREIRWLGT